MTIAYVIPLLVIVVFAICIFDQLSTLRGMYK